MFTVPLWCSLCCPAKGLCAAKTALLLQLLKSCNSKIRRLCFKMLIYLYQSPVGLLAGVTRIVISDYHCQQGVGLEAENSLICHFCCHFLFLLGIRFSAYNSTMVPSRLKITVEHTFRVDWNSACCSDDWNCPKLPLVPYVLTSTLSAQQQRGNYPHLGFVWVSLGILCSCDRFSACWLRGIRRSFLTECHCACILSLRPLRPI